MADCRAIARSRSNEPELWIDVDWDRATARLFQAALRIMVANERGVLAKVASEIADAGSNIDTVSMDDERSMHASMHFVIEVTDRRHLARVMRALRRLPEVKKLTRERE
jgi:(p)ppGpp synthase/HD superfamily hydrolase